VVQGREAVTEAQVQYLLASLDRIAAALEARVAQPPTPTPSAAYAVVEDELRSMLSAFTEGLGPRRVQPAPALTAAELVRSTYPPSATVQRARELLVGWEREIHFEDDATPTVLGQVFRDVRDFLREIVEAKP
jgi:hypothetical protein